MTPDLPISPQPSGPPSGGPPAVPPRSRRGWLPVGLAAWAVVLLVAALLSIRFDPPTVREQRSLEQAAPVVARAVGSVIAAVGLDGAVEIDGQRVRRTCQVSVVRNGAVLDSTVTVRIPGLDVAAALDRIAARLPDDWRAGVRHRPVGDDAENDGAVLRADAGGFVSVRGVPAGPGTVRVTVSTGCRPDSDAPAGAAGTRPALPVAQEPGRVLGALGATGVGLYEQWTAECPDGSAVHTVRAVGQGVPPASWPATLRPEPGTLVVTDTLEVYAHRAGRVSVVVHATEGTLRVATTTGCPG